MQQLGAGEVVQRLKTLAALPVDQDLITYTHKAAQSSITFNSNGYDCIFLASMGTRHAHDTQTYIEAKDHKHKKGGGRHTFIQTLMLGLWSCMLYS